MPAEVTREEFEARVEVVEREVEGEKMSLATSSHRRAKMATICRPFKARLDRVEHRLEGVENRLAGVEQRLGGVERKLDNFTFSLPRTVSRVVREVLDERERRKS